MGALGARGVRVHADDLHALGQKRVKLVLHALGAHAVGAHVAAAAVEAAGGRVRVGAHRPGAAAGVAHERVGALVVGEGAAAVRAPGTHPHRRHMRKVGKPAAVEEQHGLRDARRRPSAWARGAEKTPRRPPRNCSAMSTMVTFGKNGGARRLPGMLTYRVQGRPRKRPARQRARLSREGVALPQHQAQPRWRPCGRQPRGRGSAGRSPACRRPRAPRR